MAQKEEKKKEKNPKNSGHFVPQQCQRAAHALRSDQFRTKRIRTDVPYMTDLLNKDAA